MNVQDPCEVANRTILPNHHVIFDHFEHGQYIGDASEKVGEVLVPWGPAYAAMVGFNDASVNETIRCCGAFARSCL
eukprot:2911035-Amphidinium_carterae.1